MSKKNQTKNQATEAVPEDTVDYSVSGGLVALLAKHNISIALTSYQSGLLYFIGRNKDGGINIHQTGLPKPMGLHVEAQSSTSATRTAATAGAPPALTLTCGYQIMRFENILEQGQAINATFDACYVPRTVHVTGQLDAHDVGVDDAGRAIFVNTRFNCLATPSTRHSFEVVWKPDFITGLVDEDRCHLNGMAMQDGRPKYVTAVSRSNTIDGWRDRRKSGGIVIDVDTDKIICDGLSMPHSPRMHNGTLYLLNAGTGEFGKVVFDQSTNGASKGKGSFKPLAFCPGFLRGLSFHGNLAFIGLSKPRYKRFEGLDLDQKLKDADSEAWCGVQVIDLTTGACVDWFRIDGKIGEIYDVEVIPGAVCPMAVAPQSDEAAQLVTYADMLSAARTAGATSTASAASTAGVPATSEESAPTAGKAAPAKNAKQTKSKRATPAEGAPPAPDSKPKSTHKTVDHL